MISSAESNKTKLMDAIFHDYAGPAFALRLWDGWQWTSPGNKPPRCTIVVSNPEALASLVSHPDEVSLGEAFVHDDLDIEGDVFSAFAIGEHLFSRPQNLRRRVAMKLAASFFSAGQWIKHGAENSKRRDRASIAYHYDQPVAFFEPWLGPSMVYSCAYFRSEEDTLEAAQEQKLEHICRKLRLQQGERFLDIGCGWGSLALHAASRHGAVTRGITLSHQQAETAQQRIKSCGLSGRCAAELRDYRDLNEWHESFDKIASVGMYEHVGLKNLDQYFGVVRQLLRPGGLLLNHGIARNRRAPIHANSFIARYVFPTGKLVTLDQTLHAAEAQGLEVRDVEDLREHYAMTLRLWVNRLRSNADKLLSLVPRTTYRIWLLYMAGSAAAFSRGDIAVFQVLLSRPDHGRSGLPLTREDLYATSMEREPVEV